MVKAAFLALGSLLLFTSVPAFASPCAVFLVPGAFATGTLASRFFVKSEDYFSEYRKFFTAEGCKVGMASFPPDGTIEERALILKDELKRFLAESGVKEAALVAHSQGGLDARFALHDLKLSGVTALLTIGAPHHGTPVADWVVSNRDRGSLLYWGLRIFARYDLRVLRFAGEIRPEFLERFHSHFGDVPGVRYGSAVAVCRTGCGMVFRLLSELVKVGPGDGLIPASSQAYGTPLGEYDLDHVSEVGIDPEKKAERFRVLRAMWEFLGKRGK